MRLYENIPVLTSPLFLVGQPLSKMIWQRLSPDDLDLFLHDDDHEDCNNLGNDHGNDQVKDDKQCVCQHVFRSLFPPKMLYCVPSD